MIYLAEKNIKVMELLAIYKFLTISQFIKLEISKDRSNCSKILRKFSDRKKPLVKKISFGVHPQIGRLEDFYYLTKEGALFLAESNNLDIEEINYQKSSTLFFRDYFHRKATIDYHIDLRKWVKANNHSLDFFYTYFDKVGSNKENKSSKSNQKLEAKTKVNFEDGSFFIPDGIYKITDLETNKSYLYALEIYTDDTRGVKRILTQLEKHIKALMEGVISIKFNYSFANRVKLVFKDERVKELVESKFKSMGEFEEVGRVFEFERLW